METQNLAGKVVPVSTSACEDYLITWLGLVSRRLNDLVQEVDLVICDDEGGHGLSGPFWEPLPTTLAELVDVVTKDEPTR